MANIENWCGQNCLFSSPAEDSETEKIWLMCYLKKTFDNLCMSITFYSFTNKLTLKCKSQCYIYIYSFVFLPFKTLGLILKLDAKI